MTEVTVAAGFAGKDDGACTGTICPVILWMKDTTAASREAATARSCASASCSRARRATSCLRQASSRIMRSWSRRSMASRRRLCMASCRSMTCRISPSKNLMALPPWPQLPPLRLRLPPSAVSSVSSPSESEKLASPTGAVVVRHAGDSVGTG